tara:strand:- start:12441 stop:15545 length:3105 start_codon:yes stop_codon:yes gene_type:complete
MANKKIYNEIVLIWNEDTNSYDTISEDSFYYDGEIHELKKGEIEITGGSTAKKELDKIAKAARKVTEAFSGSNKVSLKNISILKILSSTYDGTQKSLKKVVEAHEEKIQKMLRLQELTRFQKAEIQAARENLKLSKEQNKQDQKIKALNIKREFQRQADAKKREAKAQQELNRKGLAWINQQKKEKAARERIKEQLRNVNFKLKQYNINLKDITRGTDLVTRAMNGEVKALGDIKRRMQEATRTGELYGKQLKGFQVRNLRNQMSLSRVRSVMLMAAFAAGTFQKAFQFLTEAYMKQEKAERMVSSAIRSTAGAAGFTSKQIFGYAAQLQKLTAVGDETILSSSALLLTFKRIGGEEFKRAQKSVIDLTLALNQGQISEEKMKASTIMLGKALDDPIAGMASLQKSGIKLSESQKQQVRTFVELGDTASAQNIILSEVESQVGGLGEAFAKTTQGKIMAMKGAFGDLQEQIAVAFMPIVKVTIVLLTKLFEVFQNKHVLIFAASLGFLAVQAKLASMKVTTLTIKQGAYSIATTIATGATKLFHLTLKNLGRFLLVGFGLEALAFIMGKITDSFSKGKSDGDEFNDAIDEMQKNIDKLTDSEQAREKAIEDNIYALEKELRILEAKTDLEKWIISQETKKEGVIYGVSEAEIALKEEILNTTEAQKELLEIEKEILKNRETLKSTTKSLADSELDFSKTLIDSFAIDSNVRPGDVQFIQGFDTDLANRIDTVAGNLSHLSEVQKLRNKTIEEFDKLGVSAGVVEGELIISSEHYDDTIKATIATMKDKFNIDSQNLELTYENIQAAIKKAEFEEKEAARQEQMLKLTKQIGLEYLNLQKQEIEERAKLLNDEMKADVARIKKTSTYKIASMRNDTKTMERLEKEAAAKTLPHRRAVFKEKQNVALAEIAIRTASSIMKAYQDYGWPAAMPVQGLLTILGAVQMAQVKQQKPPAFATGGDFVTQGPQMIMVGDNPGGRERVQVTPLSSPNINGPQGGGTVNVTFTGNVMSQEFIESEAIPQIKEAIRRGADIGIN